MQKDNTTLALKLKIRRRALSEIKDLLICETHGGKGIIWRHLYYHIPYGFVFERDKEKAAILAKQRPSWSVIEADCENALSQNALAEQPINYLDLDPYGSSLPTIEAFFSCDRMFAKKWQLLRMMVRGLI